jgi:hypothetical protein
VHSREIQLHPGEISLECAKPRYHLVKLLIMLILLAADRARMFRIRSARSSLTAFDFLCGPATQFAAPGHLAIRSRRLFSAAI